MTRLSIDDYNLLTHPGVPSLFTVTRTLSHDNTCTVQSSIPTLSLLLHKHASTHIVNNTYYSKKFIGFQTDEGQNCCNRAFSDLYLCREILEISIRF